MLLFGPNTIRTLPVNAIHNLEWQIMDSGKHFQPFVMRCDQPRPQVEYESKTINRGCVDIFSFHFGKMGKGYRQGPAKFRSVVTIVIARDWVENCFYGVEQIKKRKIYFEF